MMVSLCLTSTGGRGGVRKTCSVKSRVRRDADAVKVKLYKVLGKRGRQRSVWVSGEVRHEKPGST